jgi:hypothetical protein
LVVHENPRSGKTGGFSPSGKPYFTKRSRRGGKKGSGFSQVGQWKYLEIPLLAAEPKIKAVITGAVGEAFEKG